ncbi:MAG: peptidoglycan-associated lipoprotein Pal [Methyloligellaceae bacterium]
MKENGKYLYHGRFIKFAVMAALLVPLGLAGCSSKTSTGLITNSSGGKYRTGSIGQFEQEVGKVVRFTTDSTKLNDEARRILAAQARWLNRYAQYSILLEGHADERGTREYNIGLGAQRADAVRRYLASRGVNPSRIRTISYGKERPVALCDNISCWSQNRRVVTILNNRAGS